MKQLNLEHLSPQQREAVIRNEGPLLLLAGPGSGKTHTIIHRLIHLLNLGISPETILVITFTKEAALSMQRRFYQSYQLNVPIQFATFHSFFYQILREANPNQKLTIISSGRKRILMQNMILQKTSIRFDSEQEGYDEIERLISAISYYKNTQDLDATRNLLNGELRLHFEVLFRMYRYEMQKKNCIDFDDMLYDCYQLLSTNSRVRSHWQNCFRYVLIDEFQDINPMQYQIMKLLLQKPYHIFAVGDDDQSIYGFRGSRPELMKQFVEDYHAEVLKLETNYRSGTAIIHFSDEVISLNQIRFQKNFQTGKKIDDSKVFMRGFEDRMEQYNYVRKYIEKFQLQNAGNEKKVVLLFRTNAYMQGFAARLTQNGIEYGMKEACKSIYEHPVIQDIVAYLQLAKFGWKRQWMIRIMNKPIRFLSLDSVAEGSNIDDMIHFYELNRGYGKSYTAEIEALRKLKTQLEVLSRMSLMPAITYILKVISYENYLKISCAGNEDRREAFQELLHWMKDDASRYESLELWLEAQRKYTLELEERSGKTKANDQMVQLMTIHSAKGLEFHTVIIPDCNEKIYPHGRLPEQSALEEERRIFYVGLTRAIQNLVLCYVTGTKDHPIAASRFIRPFIEQKNTDSLIETVGK